MWTITVIIYLNNTIAFFFFFYKRNALLDSKCTFDAKCYF